MKKFLFIAFAATITLTVCAQEKFMWGVASAAYQVEGAYQADGKGKSNWDVYTNQYEVTKGFTKENQTANVSVNQYDRDQYMKDFALMKELGVTYYRFSIGWSRILPEGTGKVNQAGIDHYIRFIDDMKSFGIEPCVTLYHWDMPYALQAKGGFENPEFVDWYENYANIIFKAFGTRVKTYITFNEPYIDLFLFTNAVNNIISKKANPMAFTSEQIAHQGISAHHLIQANAKVINDYHQLKLGGRIGITLSLSPTIPKDSTNPKDVLAATRQDGLHNRFFLDASIKGTYPKDIIDLYKSYNVNINEREIPHLPLSKPDFIGVNFYAPGIVSWDDHFAMNANWMTNNPDSIKMFNGYVRPDYLYKLLMRIKNEYGNIPSIITENGAGFGERDEQLVNGKVNDSLRCNYLRRHIDAALQAKKDGANLQGYFLWSILDNFEWLFGYDKRFGIVYVDFATQKRTPKNSYYLYQKIIAGSKK